MKKSIVIVALAVELAAAATATAAPARSRADQARAQAVEGVLEGGLSPERIQSLHECNDRVARFKGYQALNLPTSIYRSCMHEHGQPE